MSSSRKKILFVHQKLEARGGANAVAAWMLEAIRDQYEVTVLTWSRADIPAVNRFYGTSLNEQDFRWIYPNRFFRLVGGLDPQENSIQPAAFLMRIGRSLRKDFDLVVCAGTEELDLGTPTLLYIHYPYLSRFWNRYRPCDGTLAAASIQLLTGKTRPWMVIAGYSVTRVKRACMLANSEWTAAVIQQQYGVHARTIYPPVVNVKGPDWTQRANGFVCVGTLEPKKRMDFVISVLQQVRAHYADVRLHLAGTRDRWTGARRHYNELCSLVEANSSWVQLHENLSREALSSLMAQNRFGIHALVDEHFGLAPAEMLMAGCIPFVHDSGGQVEIVGRDPHLCYKDEPDAVAKIAAVLASGARQDQHRTSLEQRKSLFTVSRFMREIRETAAECLQTGR